MPPKFPFAAFGAFLVDRALLRSRRVAQVLSALLLCGAIYAFGLEAADYVWPPLDAADPRWMVGREAMAWITTTTVFYGVFLEERKRLAETWSVATTGSGAVPRDAEVDHLFGCSFLCVGLLSEAALGLPYLHRSLPGLYLFLSIMSVGAVSWGAIAHVRAHWR